MHTVKRAIIMAAGIGKRMQPVTLEIPKPLIKVNGIRMIDTIIRGLLENGINEIYVVVGYKKEQFEILREDYVGIHIIENPLFDVCNNISSLYYARDYIEESIIIDGDQIIFNTNILTPSFSKSGYNAVWTDEETDEWLMQVENNKVMSCSRWGGAKGWQLFSVSRWTKEDGKKLKRHLEIEFDEKRNRQIYWDDVAMFCYLEDYDLGIMPMKKEDVVEVDNLSELIALDKTYAKYEEDMGNE